MSERSSSFNLTSELPRWEPPHWDAWEPPAVWTRPRPLFLVAMRGTIGEASVVGPFWLPRVVPLVRAREARVPWRLVLVRGIKDKKQMMVTYEKPNR